MINLILGTSGKVPGHVRVRRLKTGRLAREAIYGHKIKAVPGDAANRWHNLVRHYCGGGYLKYREFLDVARSVGQEMAAREVWRPEIYDQSQDQKFWRYFQEKLIARSVQINGPAQDGERLQAFRDNKERATVEQWQREALLNGLCPVCGLDVSEHDFCGHGFGRPEPDGTSGFVVDG